MNATIVRALLADAWYQVLDNKIFRLLLLIVLTIVAVFFVVGFREDEISILFGTQTLSYESLFGYFGAPTRGIPDLQGVMIQGTQSLLVESLAGNMAMVFCISATAFFMPRMLEKGSADVLFSKPVSRMTLVLSRYFAGLLFVTILSFVLMFGIYAGLLIVSGYHDPAFMVGTLTLIYLYGILHSFSILIGVFTRSTVAAILTSLVLFMVCGGVHSGWMLVEWKDHNDVSKQIAKLADQADGDADAAKDSRKASESNAYLDALIATLNGLHYVLPKTSDADVFTRKLRKSIDRGPPSLVDEKAELTYLRALEDLPRTRRGKDVTVNWNTRLDSPPPDTVHAGRIDVDLSSTSAVWTMTPDGPASAPVRFELSRRSRLVEPPKDASGTARNRPRKMNVKTAASEFVARLKARPEDGAETAAREGEIETLTRDQTVGGTSAVLIEWTEGTAERPSAHDAAVFVFGDSVFEARMSLDGAWPSPTERQQFFERFLSRIKLGDDSTAIDPERWYEDELTFTAPWKYNILFSIGSSLAFVVLMLALTRWRIERIDF